LEAAERLFEEHGFEHVTVAQIADAANVSVKTLFVYFRSKEDLAFTDTSFLDLCVAAIEGRPAGVSPGTAVAQALVTLLREGRQTVTDGIEGFHRGYGSAPALHARLLRMWEEYEDRVTVVLAAEAGAAPTPATRLRAIGLVGMLRALTSTEMHGAVTGLPPRDALAYVCDWLLAAGAAAALACTVARSGPAWDSQVCHSRGGTMAAEFRPVAPVDPTNLRPMLFLDVAREMMLDDDWSHRAVSVVMESHTGPGRFTFYGANNPEVIEEVHAGRIDVSILNPAVMLAMAHRGTGPFDAPRNVAAVAVLPHYDQLGFAVATRLGFTRLDEIAERRYPLRVSVRGSIDACTPIMVDVVLREHGFTLADLVAWGGEISYDQPMPNHPSRMGRLAAGEMDAIFDEGVVMWADLVAGAGAEFLPLGKDHLDALVAQGFRHGLLEQSRFPSLPGDIPTLDYSGWPIYCRADAPDALITKFCEALVSRRDAIVWDIGGPHQPPLPLERMARESPSTPQDVPLHPAAAAVWRTHGFLD
ncbi:MAG TPA: TetR family transcriptional regulator, partial [Trebonia sp.]